MLQNAFVAFCSVERSRSQANDRQVRNKFLTARERVVNSPFAVASCDESQAGRLLQQPAKTD
jgi:hypothetical protein